ncbi:MAG: PP0621 family protein [Aquabacterium sp.]|uniref:PP0621 family protein n=1 Tax=Aquabacterium sp. TaxID=1872578 RepID=UPI00271CA5FA|nr:PP0621 family protein [Aquabacterium sp.]MDO9005875.1 PP0621 family protein [Aquabacterium sp.]
MIKYLLLGFLVVLLYYVWRRPRSNTPRAPGQTAPSPLPQSMVECAHCGVHMPANEALLGQRPTGADYFCSEDHRRAGPRAH